MDPSRSGSYRDDGDDVAGAPATRRPEIDLNNPAQQEEGSAVHSPAVVDAPLQPTPVVHDYSGSNYASDNYGSSSNYGSSNYGSSSGDGYVDWTRGSIDVAPDGKLAFYENARPPTESVRSHGDTGFDLNAAVREAQERDEAYYQERLENLRKGQAMEDDQFLDSSFRNSSTAEVDPGYFKLWND